jgi:hypothetical protein
MTTLIYHNATSMNSFKLTCFKHLRGDRNKLNWTELNQRSTACSWQHSKWSSKWLSKWHCRRHQMENESAATCWTADLPNSSTAQTAYANAMLRTNNRRWRNSVPTQTSPICRWIDNCIGYGAELFGSRRRDALQLWPETCYVTANTGGCQTIKFNWFQSSSVWIFV